MELAGNGGGPRAHTLALKYWEKFVAFLDGKVHSREARREAWERAELVKEKHTLAILPPSGMLNAILKMSLRVAPRHPTTPDILSQGGGEVTGKGVGDALIHTDHCVSEEVPQELQKLLTGTIEVLAGVSPASPKLVRVKDVLSRTTQQHEQTHPHQHHHLA